MICVYFSVPTCSAVGEIVNGHTNLSAAAKVGDVVEVTCDEGYKPDDIAVLTCLDTLKYDHPVPTCIGIKSYRKQFAIVFMH